jgi:hypothetical protein
MADDKLTAKWLGAAIFWMLKGFEGKYSDQLKTEYNSRNIWIGYIIILIFFLGLVYFFTIKQ